MRRATVGLLALAAAAALATPSFASDEIFRRSYPLPAGSTFTLSNVNGSVQVDGWEREEVEVRAVKSARRNQKDLKRVQIEVEAEASSVTVRTRYPQDVGVEVSVDYHVRVPYRVRLNRVETVNGAVRVGGVEGTGELRTVNGNVELLDSAGIFSARTTNGNVRLELRHLDSSLGRANGPMSIETMNGSVVLALPASTDADLDIRSVNGDFRSELPVTAQGSLDSREFRGRLGRGGTTVRVRTVNGGIRVVTARPTI